ncbi:ras-related protein Rab-7L1-like [Scyliorhinus canicula]|uniref:ras-related protein Rab-7L1-like n=1 Tax=Scyliorhinus canicula TaxID=7830 RepID=UPI0018F4466C|nr:ras-related protein Rab-7L1-like [Scyliorhinus canicula]
MRHSASLSPSLRLPQSLTPPTMASDYLFKVLVIGDCTVGKTSLVQRYAHDSFSKNYKSTVGVDFALKIIQWSDTETIRLQLWDIAGQERFTSMTRLYYRDAGACIVMFDVANTATFRNCLKWKLDLDSKVALMDGSPVPCILLANKCDLSEWAISRSEIDLFSKENHFVGWIETSVKENQNVAQAMRVLVECLMSKPSLGSPAQNQGDYIQLSDVPKSHRNSACC